MRKLVLLLLLVSSCLLIPPWFSYAEFPEFPDQEAPPLLSFGNTEAPEIATIDWEEFWALFNTVSAWSLEYNNGSGWFSIPSDLTVIKNYTEAWLCKINLIFHASYTADYRLTFIVDRRVQNYSHVENKTRYVISYQSYRVFFDWSDLLEIPGLQFTHGVKEIYGKPCFWFRLKRENVPQGTYLELDPTFGYETVGSGTATIENTIRGSTFACTQDGLARYITAYIDINPAYGSKVKCAIYHSGNGSLLAATQQRYVGDEGWFTFNITYPEGGALIYNGSSYDLLAWGAPHASTFLYLMYDSGTTDQGHYESEIYGSWPDPISYTGHENRKYSIFCTYETVDPPNIGSFKSSEDPVYSNSWFNVNCTVNDPDGIEELVGGYLELSGDVVLVWLNGSTFWEEADPNGYCTLNSSECVEAQINSTAFEVSWRIKLSQTYPHNTRVDVGAIMYDVYYRNGTNIHSGIFLFEPEESTEPGIPTGGTVKKTPLEKLGVPTPLPYEVAPPEAQYGTIGLVVILTGGVIYYIRRPKTTQQLFRENTASRVKYGPRKARKRKIQQKKQPKRRIHTKK